MGVGAAYGEYLNDVVVYSTTKRYRKNIIFIDSTLLFLHLFTSLFIHWSFVYTNRVNMYDVFSEYACAAKKGRS